MSTVRADSEDYFFKMLKLFYFPAIYRRNERFSESQVSLLNFNFTINNVNLLPFLPDIYYKWNIPLNCILSFRSLNKFQLIFYLQLKGYVFKKQ